MKSVLDRSSASANGRQENLSHLENTSTQACASQRKSLVINEEVRDLKADSGFIWVSTFG